MGGLGEHLFGSVFAAMEDTGCVDSYCFVVGVQGGIPDWVGSG